MHLVNSWSGMQPFCVQWRKHLVATWNWLQRLQTTDKSSDRRPERRPAGKTRPSGAYVDKYLLIGEWDAHFRRCGFEGMSGIVCNSRESGLDYLHIDENASRKNRCELGSNRHSSSFQEQLNLVLPLTFYFYYYFSLFIFFTSFSTLSVICLRVYRNTSA